jgi:hypothetical protein
LKLIEDEIALAQSGSHRTLMASQLAFGLHAYVHEANWAFKLFSDKLAFSRARQAIAGRLSSGAANRQHAMDALQGEGPEMAD